MANNKLTAQQKEEMLKLLASGSSVGDVARQFNVSSRTVNRLVEASRNGVLGSSSAVVPIPIPGSAILNFDQPTSENIQFRLLRLSAIAFTEVEQTLLDPNSSRRDKLKASDLVMKWSGLGTSQGRLELATEEEKLKSKEEALKNAPRRERIELYVKTRELRQGAHKHRLGTDPKYAANYSRIAAEIARLPKGYQPKEMRQKLEHLNFQLEALREETCHFDDLPTLHDAEALEELLIEAARLRLEFDDGEDDTGSSPIPLPSQPRI